jgi:hypothetical protein
MGDPIWDDMRVLFRSSLPCLELLAPSAIWAQEWQSHHPFLVDRLISEVLRAQTAAQRRSFELLLAVSKSCWNDIVSRKSESSASEAEVLDFLQFEFAILPLGTSIYRGWLQRSYDWIAASLSDDDFRTSPRYGDASRLLKFFESDHPVIARRIGYTLCEWGVLSFYYFRRMGALTDLANGTFPFAAAAARVLLGEEDGREVAMDCLIALAGWSFDKKHVGHQDLVNALLELSDSLILICNQK